MSFNLEGAFNFVLRFQSKTITYYQVSSDTEDTITLAPSNYFRNHEMLEEMVSEGREYVISKKIFNDTFTGEPVRGDRIIDGDVGNLTIRDIREMSVFGKVVGYRVRCD